MTFELTIPGPPVGKGSVRVARAGNRRYYPKTTTQWMANATDLMRFAHTGPPMSGPLSLSLVIIKRRPKTRPACVSWPGARENWKEGGLLMWCPSTPDASNVVKAVEDCLTKAGVIEDDRFICRLTVGKYYAAKGAEPCVKVLVRGIA